MRQKTKRVLLILISVVSITTHLNAVEVGGLIYSLTGAYATVKGVADGNTNRTITIPPEIVHNGNRYVVTVIAPACFCNYFENYNGKRFFVTDGKCTEGAPWSYYTSYQAGFESFAKANSYVHEVILPKTIQNIGELSFSNPNITSIILNEGLTTIDSDAFKYAKILSLIIPKSITQMYVLGNSSLRSIYYLGSTPPENWTATSFTYVTNKNAYVPAINYIYGSNPTIIEMITFHEKSFPYTGNVPPAPTWTNNVEGYSVEMSIPTLESEAGTYEVEIPATFIKGEESFTASIPYKYRITPAKLEAKVNNTSRTYGEPNPEFSITYSGFVNGEDESVLHTRPTAITTATSASPVGTYPINLSGGEARNYTIQYEQGELTVNKASLSIQVKDSEKVYGSNNPSFMLNYFGLKNNETIPEWIVAPQFTTAATKESGTGTYPVNVSCNPKNYTIINNISGTLTITKALLTVKADDATMIYGENIPPMGLNMSGFMNDDDISSLPGIPFVTTEATSKSNVGTYYIIPQGGLSDNYDFKYYLGTLTIKPRALNVKALSTSRLYGENNPAFNIEYEGFVNNETKSVLEIEPTATTTATIMSNAGTYDIRVGGGKALNYEMTYQPGQLTITPRALKTTVGNYERPYGVNNPTFTIVYEGLVGNDTEYSLNPAPMARTNATKTSDVGTYNIEVTGGYSPNYILSYGSGKLTIVKAEQNLEWNQNLSNLKVGNQVALNAYASSGLPVTYTTDTDEYAELYTAGSKTYMECKTPGTFMIKAVQNGNGNYYSTQRINKEVTIIDDYKPILFIKQADNGMVSIKVEKGSSKTFNIHSETGWKIHSVTFNGTDVTAQLDENGSYTTPAINNNSILNVVYEEDKNSVNAPYSSQIKILPTSTGIRVTGTANGDMIRIFTFDGEIQKVVRADSSEVEIPLHKDNVYIVKVGDSTMKLCL